MNVYETQSFAERVTGNPYVGRGIVIGESPDGTQAVTAYFIMGRSENSRNRVFLKQGNDVMIKAYDESKLTDPTLIIYYPVRQAENALIVTNGDQTDTIADHLKDGGSFESALATREFEPDGPNWTPRISGIVDFAEDSFTYKLSILKSADAEGTACNRFYYDYTPIAGLGHFIHTYITDGNPIPTFCGEPERVEIPSNIDMFTQEIWESLNEQNKISLYVRYTDKVTGAYEERMINKNGGAE